MNENEHWTLHTPQVQRETNAAKTAWTLVKGTEPRRAVLRDHGKIGAELQIFVNGEFVNGRRYEK
jgi:hypothetical protein